MILTEKQKKLIPKLGPGVAAIIYDPVLWNYFARKCQRNPIMRDFIFARDLKNGCAWCDQGIYKSQRWNIHHKDYDHFCAYGKYIEVHTPSPKRVNRKYKGPDCGSCKNEKPSYFERCAGRLTLVHQPCNHAIEIARMRSSAKR